MTDFRLRGLIVFVLMMLVLASPARAVEAPGTPASPRHGPAAAAVRRLGGTGPWNAFLYREKAGRVCYLAGAPQKTEPAKFKRKAPAVMVTHRPEENATNVVSFDAGYPLKPGSDAALEIDGTHFELFTKGDTAWSRTSDLDRTIVQAMAKGRQAVFKAVPQKGPMTTDFYPLAGFAQTLALIDKACGVKR
jgi:hypothetical protein